MVIKNQSIELTVKCRVTERPGYSSIYFDRPNGFNFEAGDWIDLAFADRKLRGGYTYSLSSSPLESDLRITFKHGISEFKRALQSLEPSDRLLITQYGNDNSFSLDTNRSSTLLAGGIGIAPFRSMLGELFETGSRTDVTLIYMNQTEDFLFKAELDAWKGSLPGLRILYIPTKDISRKKREAMITGLTGKPEERYFIAGPEGMVERHEHQLLNIGIPLRDIRIESFSGYL